MTVSIEKEPFNVQLFEEMRPLCQKCWQEGTIAKGEKCAFYGERDFVIEPYLERYLQLTDMGSLVVFAVRDAGRLVGYLEGFTYRALHHQSIIGGMCDSMYLEPEYRAYAAVAVAKFVAEMTSRGVQILGWPTTPEGDIYKLLKAQGFVGDDIVMEKRLCV